MGGVVVASCVAIERYVTGSRVSVGAGVVSERVITGRRVSVAGCVAYECSKTSGGVFVACCVANERFNADGCIVVAASVLRERDSAGGGVIVAGSVAIERLLAGGRVANARRKTEKRVITFSRVLIGIASVRWWVDRASRRRERKAREDECAKEKTAPPKRALSWAWEWNSVNPKRVLRSMHIKSFFHPPGDYYSWFSSLEKSEGVTGRKGPRFDSICVRLINCNMLPIGDAPGY